MSAPVANALTKASIPTKIYQLLIKSAEPFVPKKLQPLWNHEAGNALNISKKIPRVTRDWTREKKKYVRIVIRVRNCFRNWLDIYQLIANIFKASFHYSIRNQLDTHV